MSEVIPRWGMPEVNFVESDPERVLRSLIAGYEKVTGRTLQNADPIYLYLCSIAAVVIQLKSEINHTGQQNLLTYAQGEKLDALGVLFDVKRTPASSAVTTIEFRLNQSLEGAYVIPSGFEVTNGRVTFATVSELIIPPGLLSGEVEASCTTPGEVGNGHGIGQIQTIVKPMPYLESAKNIVETAGGAERENDPEYAQRMRFRVDGYSVAGPRLAYVYHAKSFSNAISDVAVMSPVPGEVDVFTLLKDGEFPSESFLRQLYEYLSSENIRPLTDYVVCKSPKPVSYSIRVDYWISDEDKDRADSIRSNVTAAVEEFKKWQQGRIGRDITPGKLTALVFNGGASRIDSETLSPRDFQEIESSEVAQCENLEVNFMGYKEI